MLYRSMLIIWAGAQLHATRKRLREEAKEIALEQAWKVVGGTSAATWRCVLPPCLKCSRPKFQHVIVRQGVTVCSMLVILVDYWELA